MMRMYDTNNLIQTWQPRILRIRATISGLDHPCIPFALLKYDPLPPFLRSKDITSNLVQPCIRGIYCTYETWQRAFAALSEEQRFFLYAWSASGKASPRVVQEAALIIGIATPGPHYKRWLTTGALRRQGEIVAWRVEIAMLPSSERVAEIVLSEENMLRLLSYASST
jgi:hypothetical protein